jgi:hypothetical protein
LHTFPFASAAADRPLHGEPNGLAASEHGLLLVGDLFERRLIVVGCVVFEMGLVGSKGDVLEVLF